MNTDFYRIKRLPPYIFEEVNRIKARLRAEGTDIIDFGMGNPDMPTPPHIIEKLIETVPLKNVTSRFAMERIKQTTALPIVEPAKNASAA